MEMARWRGRLAGCLCAVTLLAGPAAGQSGAARDSAKAARESIFVPTDALYAGGFLLGTLAMYPIDRAVADAVQEPGRQANDLLRGAATGFRLLGNPGSLLISSGMYAVGRVAGHSELADVGLHTAESLATAIAITGAVKGLAGRARPEADQEHPYRFGFGRGFSADSFQSFPSGHTSSAFATAAAVSAEIGRIYPKTRVWVKPLLYGGAGLVGISRTYNNKHWASDVVAGAALGTFTGWKVVRYNHTHRGNRLDRIFLEAHISATPDGVLVAWTF
jgi:membrane-associated phospholipid phosphatase